MIPEEIVTFLQERGTVAVAGTRNAECIPEIRYVSGWSVEEDHATISCSIAEGFATDLTSSLDDNGQFALTVEEIGSHETYQFKGKYIESHLPSDADIESHLTARSRFGSVVNELFGLPEEVCAAYISKPVIAVRFEVQEIFLQTPGPGAGSRLFPQEEQ